MGSTWGPSRADGTQVGPMLPHDLCYLGGLGLIFTNPAAETDAIVLDGPAATLAENSAIKSRVFGVINGIV